MNTRQSAGSWFQRASRTSAPTSSSSDGDSDGLTASRRSEIAIARIVMGVLAEARLVAPDPIGGPIDEPCPRHAPVNQHPRRFGGVDEPRVGRLAADEHRLLAETL